MTVSIYQFSMVPFSWQILYWYLTAQENAWD